MPAEVYDETPPKPGESKVNWGFSIERLKPGEYHGTGRTDEIFSVTSEDRRADLIRRVDQSDGVRVLGPNDYADPGEQVLGMVHTEWIDWNRYKPEMQAGRVPKVHNMYGLGFDQVHSEDPRMDAVAEAFPIASQEQLVRDILQDTKAEFGVSNHSIDSMYGTSALGGMNPGLEDILKEALEHAPEVTEVFEFTVFGRTSRLYNFDKLLTPLQLKQLINAMRAVADRAGGLRNLKTMAIFPSGKEDEHADDAASNEQPAEPNFWKKYWNRGAEALGRADPSSGFIEFNAAALKKEVLASGENADTYTVGGESFEAVAHHELVHLFDIVRVSGNQRSMFHELLDDEAKKSPAASKYAQEYPFLEEAPEAATGLHVGGEWAKKVDDKRFLAAAAMWDVVHTQEHGPAFMHCREIDPTSPEAKYAARPSRPIAIRMEADYRIRVGERDSVAT